MSFSECRDIVIELMDKGTVDFAAFRREFHNLCDKYHVLLKIERVRRDTPYDIHPKFYEAEISLKVSGGIGNDWIESK